MSRDKAFDREIARLRMLASQAKRNVLKVPVGEPRDYVPPGAEERARTSKLWYEENSPGQLRTLNAQNIFTVETVVPVLEVRDFGEPQAITLQLDRTRVAGGVYNAMIRARVTYGVGGASDTFECDWADGGMVTIVAQRLTVVARADATNPANPFNMGDLEMIVAAAVGKETPSVIMPTFTETTAEIPALNVSSAFVPPAFAKAVSILAENTTTPFADPYPDLQAIFFAIGGGTIQGRIDGGYIGGGSAMPIPNDGALFIRNLSATDAIQPTLIWHLGL